MTKAAPFHPRVLSIDIGSVTWPLRRADSMVGQCLFGYLASKCNIFDRKTPSVMPL